MSFEHWGYRLDYAIDEWKGRARRLVDRLLGRKRPKITPSDPLLMSMITQEALKQFRNSNAFLARMDAAFDGDQATIGQNLRIRLPVDYKVRQPEQANGAGG